MKPPPRRYPRTAGGGASRVPALSLSSTVEERSGRWSEHGAHRARPSITPMIIITSRPCWMPWRCGSAQEGQGDRAAELDQKKRGEKPGAGFCSAPIYALSSRDTAAPHG